MRLLRTVVFILALGVLLLPGCSPAESVCQPENLVAPHLNSPSDYAHLTDNTPWLTWEMKAVTYPWPGGPVACHPEKYRISISTAPLFTDELGSEVTAMEVTGGWTSPALQYGKTYRWHVAAISGGVLGPTSVTRTFSVASVCTKDQLQGPVLLAPANHSIVHTTRPTFRWATTMTCVPTGYVLHWFETYAHPWCLSDGVHGDLVIAPDVSGTLDDIGTDLKDCTQYQWLVSACTDPSDVTTCVASGGPGDWEWSFTVMLPGTNFCPTPAGLGSASECYTPPAPPSPVPPEPMGAKPWEVTANANCRVCPSGACNESGFAPKGYLAPIEGRNEDATWFRIKDPHGVSCWVWGGALQVPPDAGGLGLLAYPTAPVTEVPAPAQVQCSRFKDIKTCINNPPCTWDRVKQACVRP